MPKISVIMPSLNVVKYIKPCMESIIKQTFRDIEIICVDAGSTDGTLEILNEYAMQDKRIRVVVSEKRSYGVQMNLGIKESLGDYIAIAETDDIVPESAYEKLYKCIVENKLDFTKGYAKGFWEIGDGYNYEIEVGRFADFDDIAEKVISPSEMPQLLVKDIYHWLGLYDRSFIEKNNINFNETPGAAFQDQGFLLKSLSSAKRAMYIDEVVYMYRQDNSSSSIYNTNGFKYIHDEYALNREYAESKGDGWVTGFYTRMLNQSNGRFSAMGLSGKYWSEAEEYISAIKTNLISAHERQIIGENNLTDYEWNSLKLFIAGSEVFYHSYADEYSVQIEQLLALIEKCRNKKVVIWGCGVRGKFAYPLLRMCGMDVVAYCDNNVAKHGEKQYGVEIMSLEKVTEKYSDAVFVIANKHHKDEIRKQLEGYKISSDKIIDYNIQTNALFFNIKV